MVKHSTNEAKQDFFKKCLSNPNTKGVWNIVNRLLRYQNHQIKHDIHQLNQHFANTAERVLRKIPDVETSNFSQNTGTFSFHCVTTEEVINIMKKMKTDIATGPDNIPAKFIKPIFDYLAPHITNIINCCIQNHIFPSDWKRCKICPVQKINNPMELDHYRPISILPCLSKIYEKIMGKQIMNHMESSGYFPTTMSGCRKGHSTTTALLHIRDTCYRALKANELTLLTLIDYSKAFDTVNHSKLLNLLSQYNFSNDAISTLKSYLSNRTQFIQYLNHTSEIINTKSGVPQGSILAPIIFNIYTASLNFDMACKGFTTVNYVDDFQLTLTGNINDLQNMKEKTSEALYEIKTTSSNLDLSFNSNKSNFLIIGKTNQLKLDVIKSETMIQIEPNISINRVQQQKNLGVIFDEKLTFFEHHTENIKSCYAILHTLKHLKNKLSVKNKTTIINSLIFSKLSFGDIITYPISSHWTLKYNRLFKASLSFIYGKYIHSSDIHNYNLLTPENMWKTHLLTFTFQALFNNDFPSHLKLLHQPSNNYSLRSQQHPLIINNYSKAPEDFQHIAATLYNSLPAIIRDISGSSNIAHFKQSVKQHLLSKQCSS
jgi:hypothetical protein